MSHPYISLIVPSALRTIPGTPTLWLERAIHSALTQAVPPKEIIIGLDPSEHLPGSIMALSTEAIPIRQANGAIKGHQAACNAAAARASNPLLVFLEDDDSWTETHLETLAHVLHETGVSFVSSSQLEVDIHGESLGRVFDFPTASGWLLTRLTWLQATWLSTQTQQPGFNTRFRIHHDNEYLGRLNARGVPRAHVIETTADLASRPQLAFIAQHARMVQVSGLESPSVRRTIHEGSIMGQMGQARGYGGERMGQSARELAACQVLYGAENTW